MNAPSRLGAGPRLDADQAQWIKGSPTERARRLDILVPYIRLSSFIRHDIEILEAKHRVTIVPCRPAWRVVVAMRALFRTDCLLCWFGSVRFLPLCLVARLLRKRVVVIAGGYDLAALPEIEYGNMRGGLTRVLGRWLFRAANRTLCISHSAAREARDNAGIPSERLEVLHLAFDGSQLGGGGSSSVKQRLVLTVAGIDASTIHRKGLLAVAAVSRLLPEVAFVIAGAIEPEAGARLRAIGGPNLTLTGYVSDEELDRLFRRARVYFQPSVHEAFGCSVAEAMLYECIPVVTARYALPEVVGESGYYVEPEDYAGMAAAIRRALEDPSPGPEMPRARVLRAFPVARRANRLLELVEGVAG